VFDVSGEIINYVAVKRDITEQLKINKEKIELEKQYNQAQKMETVGLLAGGIAHDLNNLLTPVLGYSEMITEEFGGAANSKKYAGNILQAAKGARDIVSKLLAFSRQQALEMEPVNLNHLVLDSENQYMQIVSEDVSLLINPSDDLPPVMGDPEQLKQVMIDLVQNAKDAMPGGGMLSIETTVTKFNDESEVIGDNR